MSCVAVAALLTMSSCAILQRSNILAHAKVAWTRVDASDVDGLPSSSQFVSTLRGSVSAEQHIFVVRHGDKYTSYPPCPGVPGQPCYDKDLMGINPPLTECGIRQAAFTANWLLNSARSIGGIQHVVASPYARTLQTALPLATALQVEKGLQLQVEDLLSEAMQPEGPFRAFNINAPAPTVSQLRQVHQLWDHSYGSVPIATPENNSLYNERMKDAAKLLKRKFPPSSGNIVLVTHATTSFSIAYGLCHSDKSSDSTLQQFVNNQAAIGPAGVIHIIRDSHGQCRILPTQNVADPVNCGLTPPFKCEFDDYPSWYWEDKRGSGPGLCH